MQITALGHSCVLLDFGTASEGRTRVLVDPWLSDHATGDAMGRFPRLRFELERLAPVHAVYLSHAHCDHLDPYSLLRLWQELPSPPTLILPESLRFLVPVFEEHLEGVETLLLSAHQRVSFRGVELLGFFDPGDEANNEDDVMVLVISHGSERVLIEADARLSLELPRFRQFIAMLLQAPGVDSAVWLTTENELTGTMLGRTCQTPEEREEVAALAWEELMAHIDQLYRIPDPSETAEGELDALVHPAGRPLPDSPWQLPHLLRLVHGQGLAAPHHLDSRWHSVLFPVRVEDRVSMERQVAGDRGMRHRIDHLEPGTVHTVEAGQPMTRHPVPGLFLLDHELNRAFDVESAFFPRLPCAPLWPGPRDRSSQKERILRMLNQRFLPYLHGQRRPPVLHLIGAHGGAYRVRVHYGDQPADEVVDYVLSYGARGFRPTEPTEEPAAEAYWAHDLEDFLDGHCDEFSPTCRTQLPAEELRLWTSLAAPLLNSDLVEARVRLHFERARRGGTAEEWVRAMVDGLGPDARAVRSPPPTSARTAERPSAESGTAPLPLRD